MPKEQPLQAFRSFVFILESKDIIFIMLFKKVEKFSSSLKDGEGW
jgi:hypothetical protein